MIDKKIMMDLIEKFKNKITEKFGTMINLKHAILIKMIQKKSLVGIGKEFKIIKKIIFKY